MNIQAKKNAEFCGAVPLHQTNLIQPHGVLLIAEKKDLRITQVSENAIDILEKPAREIVNTFLHDYILPQHTSKLKERMNSGVSGRLPFLLDFHSGRHLAVIKPQDGHVIIEIEKQGRPANAEDSFIAVYQDIKYAMAAIEQAPTTEAACSNAIIELKRITGFDKIMVYKFDEAWNGDVIAEVMEEGMDSYMGLKFPASDIPRQARELYQKMPYRLIPNIHYEPVPLYPVVNTLTGAFTDLSDSNLRSVAAVHLEYLQNMNVQASMSTRILENNQLWGLIACHHRTPKYLSFEACALFELVSNVISAKIASVQSSDRYNYKTQMHQLQTTVIERIYKGRELFSGLLASKEDLLQLLGADGIALVFKKNIESFGSVPNEEELEELVFWLQALNINKMYHQPSLSYVFEQGASYAKTASGLMVLPVQAEKGEYILAFRKEAVSKVNWGGNPDATVYFEADGKKYHPRASFNMWQEMVNQTAIPWNPGELETAESFRNFIVEFTLNSVNKDF